MTYSSVLRSTIALAALASLSLSCSADTIPVKYPALQMHGETYQSACMPEHLSKLKAALLKEPVNETDQLWRAVRTMLCAPKDRVSRRLVKSLLPSKVRRTTESTGDEPRSKLIARTDGLIDKMLAEGKVWNACIRSIDEGITLQYFSNEACVESRKLKWANNKWSIVQIGSACD